MPVRVYSLIDVLKQLNQDSTQFLAPNPNEITSQFVQGQETSVLTPSWPNYKYTVLADAPLAYWKLDELLGQVWHDICGNYDMQIVGQIGTNVILGAADPIAADQTGAAQLDGVGGLGYAAGGNLVVDGSFEDVDDTALQNSWNLTTQWEWSFDRTTSIYGSQSLLCTRTITTASNWNEAYQALVPANGSPSQLMPITPNAVYFVSIWSKQNAGTVNSEAKVVWYKADGSTISAQRSQDFLFVLTGVQAWQNWTATLIAPTDAAFASLHMAAGWWDGTHGSNTQTWFDGFVFCPLKTPTNLLADAGFEWGGGTIAVTKLNWNLGNPGNWLLDSTTKIAGAWGLRDSNNNPSGWDAASTAANGGTFPTGIAINPNGRYHVGAWFNQSEGTRQTHIKILWYQDLACTTFSAIRTTDFIVGGTDGQQAWTFYGGALTAPYDAHACILQLMSGFWANLVTANQASLETGTTGWNANGNCAIAQSGAQFLDGTKSLSLTSIAAGDMQATTNQGTGGSTVAASTQYTAGSYFRSAVSARSCKVRIWWWQASGAASTIKAFSDGTTVADTTSGWTQCTVTDTSPSDAAFASVGTFILATGAASEVHFIDCIGLVAGARTGWPGVATFTWWDNAVIQPIIGLQGMTDMTVEAWINHTHHTAGGNAERILFYRDSSANAFQGWEFNVDSSDKLNFSVVVNANTFQTAVSSGTISLNTWHHVVGVRKGGSIFLYIDGALDSVTTGVNLGEVVEANPIGAHLILGAWDCPPAFQSLWTGSMDEVAIYPYALSSQRILTHYQVGSRTSGAGSTIPYAWHVANDDGPTGFWLMSDPLGSTSAFDSNPYTQKFPATVNGTVVFEKTGLPSAGGPTQERLAGGRTAYFDGSTGYLDIAAAVFDPSGTKSYSMEVWFRPDVVDATFRRIMGVEPTVNHGVDLYWQNGVGFGTLRGDSGAGNDVVTGGTPAVAKWSHLVTTYDGTTLRLYVDGEAVTGGTASSRSADVGAAHLRIGGTTAGGTNGQGTYWGAAVYPVALTAAQVAAHYQWANPNLLTENQSSFENGTINGYVTGGGASTAISSAYALDGKYSCSLTSTSASWPSIQLPADRSAIPVEPGKKYTALASFRCDPGSPTRTCNVQLNWMKVDGTNSSHPNDSGFVTDAIGSWTQCVLTANAPSDAAYVSVELFISVAGAGETHYIDCVSFAAGPSTIWTPGGRTASAGFIYGLTPDSRYGWFTYPNPPQRGGNRWGFAIWGSFLWG